MPTCFFSRNKVASPRNPSNFAKSRRISATWLLSSSAPGRDSAIPKVQATFKPFCSNGITAHRSMTQFRERAGDISPMSVKGTFGSPKSDKALDSESRAPPHGKTPWSLETFESWFHFLEGSTNRKQPETRWKRTAVLLTITAAYRIRDITHERLSNIRVRKEDQTWQIAFSGRQVLIFGIMSSENPFGSLNLSTFDRNPTGRPRTNDLLRSTYGWLYNCLSRSLYRVTRQGPTRLSQLASAHHVVTSRLAKWNSHTGSERETYPARRPGPFGSRRDAKASARSPPRFFWSCGFRRQKLHHSKQLEAFKYVLCARTQTQKRDGNQQDSQSTTCHALCSSSEITSTRIV